MRKKCLMSLCKEICSTNSNMDSDLLRLKFLVLSASQNGKLSPLQRPESNGIVSTCLCFENLRSFKTLRKCKCLHGAI